MRAVNANRRLNFGEESLQFVKRAGHNLCMCSPAFLFRCCFVVPLFHYTAIPFVSVFLRAHTSVVTLLKCKHLHHYIGADNFIYMLFVVHRMYQSRSY